MPIKKRTEYFSELDWLKAIAIVLVVITHSSFNEIFNVNPIVAYSDIFAHLSVPIFLFVSGFLSYGKESSNILKRFPKILSAYFLMSLLCQLIKFRTDLFSNWNVIIYNLLTGDSFGIYYFVFVLCYLYLLAIVLNKFKKYLLWIFIVITLVSIPFFIYSTIPENNLYFVSRELYYRFPLNWLFFFVGGMLYRSLPNIDFFLRNKKKILFLFIVSIVLIFYSQYLHLWSIYGSFFWFLFSTSGILTLYLYFYKVKTDSIANYLANNSYSIYLLHIFPLTFISYFLTIPDSIIKDYSLPITIVLIIGSLMFAIVVRELCVKIFKERSIFIVGS